MKPFTFWQKHYTAIIYHKNWRSCFLLYWPLADIFSLQLKDLPTRGKGFWKLNNSLTSNDDYVKKMRNQISETIRMLHQDKITDKHLRWEFLKIRKFTIDFSEKLVKEENKDWNFLEKELKNWKTNLNNLQKNDYFLECKQKL